jgi:hypothetical protein
MQSLARGGRGAMVRHSVTGAGVWLMHAVLVVTKPAGSLRLTVMVAITALAAASAATGGAVGVT